MEYLLHEGTVQIEYSYVGRKMAMVMILVGFGEKDLIVFAIHDVANDYENIVTIFNLVWHTIQGSVFLATLVALHFTPVSH